MDGDHRDADCERGCEAEEDDEPNLPVIHRSAPVARCTMSCDNKFRSAMTLKAWNRKCRYQFHRPIARHGRAGNRICPKRDARLHDCRDLVMPDLPKVL